MDCASRIGPAMFEGRFYVKSSAVENENGSPELPPRSRSVGSTLNRGAGAPAETASALLGAAGHLDDLVKGLERLCAAHEVAVDHEPGSTPDARLVADRGILVD